MLFLNVNKAILIPILVFTSSILGKGLEPEIPVYPFARVVEGYSLPFVEDVAQKPSTYWDIGAGLSYEYLTIAASVRSHFLASESDTIINEDMELATEGHTVMAVAHIEGKADISSFRFAANIDLGMIWFHEYDHLRYSWSRSKLPIIGLGLDFRVPVGSKIAFCVGGGYMAAFEGFEVNAKAYNSVFGTVGLTYDGGMLE